MAAIPKKSWLTFCVLSLVSILIWQKFTAPQLSFIDLSISKQEARQIAFGYLTKDIGIHPVDLKDYHSAIVFASTDVPDQYLQKAIGFKKELAFLKEFDFEFFYWSIRFYKENQKEEYRLSLSAATGEVLSYRHVIDSNAYRPLQTEEEARQRVVAFLKKKYHFNPELYTPRATNSQKLEKRTDYSFAWEHKAVKLPWSKDPETGWARLHTGASVSGNEILGFYKAGLDIPDQYYRYMDRIQNVGRNISVLFRIIFYIILTSSIFYVILRRNNLVMHSVKKFTVGLTIAIFFTYLASYVNNFEGVLYNYPTTAPMASFLWRNIMSTVMDTFIAVLSILMPCLAGESLHQEVFPEKKEGAFLHYLRTTFFSRNVTAAILFGYLTACIMMGIQSMAFELGQRYLGVWIQYSWMAQLSGCYLPLLAAFVLGTTASFSEEICFRLFGINIGKKFFKNTFVACLISSIIWGYGHSGYLVFPMWFRGLEVMSMGLFLSYVYLRFGIITVITAHYIFDVFWGSAAYLFGKSPASQFYGSLFILVLPLILAFIAFLANKKVVERPLAWKLSIHQLFNLEVLKEYLVRHNLLAQKPPEQLKHEIASHGWDLAVVEIAIDDLTKKKD